MNFRPAPYTNFQCRHDLDLDDHPYPHSPQALKIPRRVPGVRKRAVRRLPRPVRDEAGDRTIGISSDHDRRRRAGREGTPMLKVVQKAGLAEYGYCASHSRYFWGLRLHLICTLHGLPVGWALTGAKADERTVLADLIATTPAIQHRDHTRQLCIADKNYYGRAFTNDLRNAGITTLRPTRKGENPVTRKQTL